MAGRTQNGHMDRSPYVYVLGALGAIPHRNRMNRRGQRLEYGQKM